MSQNHAEKCSIHFVRPAEEPVQSDCVLNFLNHSQLKEVSVRIEVLARSNMNFTETRQKYRGWLPELRQNLMRLIKINDTL